MKHITLAILIALFSFGCNKTAEKKARVEIKLTGVVQSDAPIAPPAEIPAVPSTAPKAADEVRPTFPDLDLVAAVFFTFQIPDLAGKEHPVMFYFYRTADQQYQVSAYLSHEGITQEPVPVLLTDAAGNGRVVMEFKGGKERTNPPADGKPDLILSINWPGAAEPDTVAVNLGQLSFDSVHSIEGAVAVQNNLDIRTKEGVIAHLKTNPGFFLALDESGGSVGGTLSRYRIPDEEYKGPEGKVDLEKAFTLAHQLRVRMVTSPAFSKDTVVGVILFDDSVTRMIGNETFAQFLLSRETPPILKIDEGPQDPVDGVRLMKPLSKLQEHVALAHKHGIVMTKMRSIILEANSQGIKAAVAQQFEFARTLCKHGLIPILEPERDLKCPAAAEADRLIVAEIKAGLDKLPEGYDVCLKLSLPAEPGAYDELIKHPRVVKVVALSGGHDLENSCNLLDRNPGMAASFSRAAREGLTRDMDDITFNARFAANVNQIYAASVT